jgi:hypothetical protein
MPLPAIVQGVPLGDTQTNTVLLPVMIAIEGAMVKMLGALSAKRVLMVSIQLQQVRQLVRIVHFRKTVDIVQDSAENLVIVLHVKRGNILQLSWKRVKDVVGALYHQTNQKRWKTDTMHSPTGCGSVHAVRMDIITNQ